MPAITGTLLVNLGKQLLKDMTKKAVKATAKKAVKSVVKKKKVKGKDVAKKMFGDKEDKGGALTIIPKGDIVPSLGGDIVPSKSTETEGQIVKVSGTAAKDLGLNDFMESLTKVRDSVNGIKVAINDNNKDTLDRIEAQRILNNDLKKKEREKGLEDKKPGIGQKMLSSVKDPAEGFLVKMARFATMTLLGSLIAALMGGAKDIILAFRIGIEALKKGLPTLLKGVKALKSGIGKAFNLVLRPFKSLGRAIFEGFQALGSKLFGWVSKAIKNVGAGIKNFGKTVVQTGGKVVKNVASFAAKKLPKVAQTVAKTKQFLGQTVTKGKDFVKSTATKAKDVVKSTATKAKDFVKSTATKGKDVVKSTATKAKDFVKSTATKGKDFVKSTAKNVGSKIKNVAKPVVSKVKSAAKPVVSKIGKIIGKLFGKQAGKAAVGPGIKTLFKSMAKGAKAIRIPVVGPLLVALMSMFAGDPMKQTLFKTAGAAIGGGLGLALGPIGMIVGEIAGEFVGDVLYTGFSGEAGGWKAAGKKLKDKFFQIVKGGKVVLNWIGNGFGRFFKNFVEEHKIPIPKGGGVQTILGKILPFLADKDGLVTSIPNIFQLYNPFKMGPLLLKSFFPPKDEGSSEGGDIAASIGEQSNGNSVDVESISESASYEDGGEEDPTIVMGSQGGQSASSPSQAGKTRLISLGLDKQTILNSQYEMSSNAALYKV